MSAAGSIAKGMTVEPDDFGMAILGVLAEAPPPGSVSLPRLAKRLDVSASALLRHLTMMGDAVIAGHAGPGWVRVVNREERWIVSLTPEGRAAVPADCRARCGP